MSPCLEALKPLVAGQEPVVDADRAQEEAERELELEHGMRALIAGALLPSGESAAARP